jgi:hypothetical protein
MRPSCLHTDTHSQTHTEKQVSSTTVFAISGKHERREREKSRETREKEKREREDHGCCNHVESTQDEIEGEKKEN